MNTITGTLLKISILAALVSACSSRASELQVGVQPSDPQSTPSPEPKLCDNPFFPVKQGASWTYASSNNLSEPFSFTSSITEVRTDGFTLSTTFDNLTRTHEWSCRPEGLVALSFGDGPAGGITTEGLNLEITTSNISGVSIPPNPQPGNQWNYSLDLAGSVTLPDGQKGQGQGSMTTPMTAIGMESVSVPAGTFQALRIDSVPSINLTASYLGIPIPLAFTGNVSIWFAPGVGWIKSIQSGEFFGTSINSTIELQSFQIP